MTGGRGIALAMLLAASAAPVPALGDADLLRIDRAPFDKGAKQGHHEVIGTHRGVRVVADYPCSDLCPAYTTRIIHYDVVPGAACARAGGVTAPRWVPIAIAVAQQDFCVPPVLARPRGTEAVPKH